MPAPRCYLLPFAGGGPRCYDRLVAAVDDVFEPVVLTWEPGTFHGEHGVLALARELAAEVADDLARRPVDRYGLFGHSMGSLVAFELADALRQRGVAAPALLGVSGRVPPQFGSRPAADPDDPASVAAYLRSCGGELAVAAEDPEFVEVVAERLAGDIGLGVDHRHRPRPPLDYPVIAFGGVADPLAGTDEMLGWLEHGSDGGALHLLDGGHWFVWEHAALVTAILAATLHAPACATA